jgi:hypothetical protein
VYKQDWSTRFNVRDGVRFAPYLPKVASSDVEMHLNHDIDFGRHSDNYAA